jgi:hypothetical protein
MVVLSTCSPQWLSRTSTGLVLNWGRPEVENYSMRRRADKGMGLKVALAAAGVLPTVFWALRDAALMVDDWSFAVTARLHGVGGFESAVRARPLGGAYYALAFNLFHDHPLPHLLVLAVLNAVAAVLVWAVARRLMPQVPAVLTTLVWVALANRGTSRLWITAAPNMLALCLLLGGALLMLRRSSVPLWPVCTLVVLSALTYEGPIALGALTVAAGAWRTGGAVPTRLRNVALWLVPVGLAGIWVLTFSAKHDGSPYAPFENVSRLFAAHLGTAVLPDVLLPLGAVLLGVVAWAAGCALLPSLPLGAEERVVLGGLGVLLLGTAPFAVAGFPFATDGIFDRGNLYAGLGTAMVLGGALALCWRIRQPLVASAVVAPVVLLLALHNAVDLGDWSDAASQGRALLAAAAELGLERLAEPSVVAPLPSPGGVAMFAEPDNLAEALIVTGRGGAPHPRIQVARTDVQMQRMVDAGARPYRFDGARLLPLDHPV